MVFAHKIYVHPAASPSELKTLLFTPTVAARGLYLLSFQKSFEPRVRFARNSGPTVLRLHAICRIYFKKIIRIFLKPLYN